MVPGDFSVFLIIAFVYSSVGFEVWRYWQLVFKSFSHFSYAFRIKTGSTPKS